MTISGMDIHVGIYFHSVKRIANSCHSKVPWELIEGRGGGVLKARSTSARRQTQPQINEDVRSLLDPEPPEANTSVTCGKWENRFCRFVHSHQNLILAAFLLFYRLWGPSEIAYPGFYNGIDYFGLVFTLQKKVTLKTSVLYLIFSIKLLFDPYQHHSFYIYIPLMLVITVIT